jgi:hypothetical protein
MKWIPIVLTLCRLNISQADQIVLSIELVFAGLWRSTRA